MADYTDIGDNELMPDEPITSLLGFRFRNNPVAIAEGAPGAPKVLGKALDIDIGNLSGTDAVVGLEEVSKLLLMAQANSSIGSGSRTATVGYQRRNLAGSWSSTSQLASHTVVGTDNTPMSASVAGAAIVDMVGYDGIRLAGAGTLSGAVIWVEGV